MAALEGLGWSFWLDADNGRLTMKMGALPPTFVEGDGPDFLTAILAELAPEMESLLHEHGSTRPQ